MLGSQIDFVAVVFARQGAGGEFLMSLLKSHNSTLWDGFKFHCFQHIYTGPEEQLIKLHHHNPNFINDVPVELQQPFDYTFDFASWSTTVPNIFLKFDYTLLKRFRQYRIKRHRLAHMFATSCEQFDKLFDESLFISDNNTTVIDYFNPLDTYDEICDTLKLSSNIEHYKNAWINYYMFQMMTVPKSDVELRDRFRTAIKSLV